jgi:malonyl-CoA/methylmalonyl-CoA synthetase
MPDGARHSYLDLVSLSARIANVLVTRGVRPSDRVAEQIAMSSSTW